MFTYILIGTFMLLVDLIFSRGQRALLLSSKNCPVLVSLAIIVVVLLWPVKLLVYAIKVLRSF